MSRGFYRSIPASSTIHLMDIKGQGSASPGLVFKKIPANFPAKYSGTRVMPLVQSLFHVSIATVKQQHKVSKKPLSLRHASHKNCLF